MEQLSFDDMQLTTEPVVVDIDEIVAKIGAAARPVDSTAERPTATERYYEEIGGRFDPAATARYHLALARSSLRASGANLPNNR